MPPLPQPHYSETGSTPFAAQQSETAPRRRRSAPGATAPKRRPGVTVVQGVGPLARPPQVQQWFGGRSTIRDAARYVPLALIVAAGGSSRLSRRPARTVRR